MSGSRDVERAELHKTIWRLANELRGSVDGWDFKSYVLGMLFYRFISENLVAYLNEQERRAGDPDFDYAQLSDADAEFGRVETVKEKGFYILPSSLFANVRKRARKDENLNETLSKIFAAIEGSASGTESEQDINGLFADLDVNSARLGATVAKRNDKLVKLLEAIGDLPLTSGGFSNNSIDLFGDAYEYLMQMYASTAGKSGGEYYTPQEVSELLARITVAGKTEVNRVVGTAITPVSRRRPAPIDSADSSAAGCRGAALIARSFAARDRHGRDRRDVRPSRCASRWRRAILETPRYPQLPDDAVERRGRALSAADPRHRKPPVNRKTVRHRAGG